MKNLLDEYDEVITELASRILKIDGLNVQEIIKNELQWRHIEIFYPEVEEAVNKLKADKGIKSISYRQREEALMIAFKCQICRSQRSIKGCSS